MDYKDTINLPKTPFPMKANLPAREPAMLSHWQEMDLYAKIQHAGQGKPRFTLHDGPPYANGDIHIGHALNKILKDIIIKSQTMNGSATRYVPGWDCHGLPIEINVEKKLGKQKQSLSTGDVRRKCRDYARNFVDTQREAFQRLGVLGEWDAPYLTMSNSYSAAIVREFGRFAAAGNLYKQKKPIQWCVSCKTALAEAEVEYEEETSPSVFIKFPVTAGLAERLPEVADRSVQVLIWTTTPWTIPANLAICVNPDFDYVALEADGDILIMAEGLVSATMLRCSIDSYRVLARVPGRQLEGLTCRHPLYDRASPLILGSHVTLDAGTGCVHTAPGHGQDDYVVGSRYGLPVYAPVDDRGCFTDEVPELAGTFVFEANRAICDRLRAGNALLHEEQIAHSYPHCWRCKRPVIFRATEQWFVSMATNDLRDRALSNIQQVLWIPSWGRERIAGMVTNRPDWCISRQRSWGVPIAAFYCAKCNTVLLDPGVINHVADLFEQHGSDIWFDRDAADLLPAGTVCGECGHGSFSKETDILDVWFDSGVSHAAVLEQDPQLGSPAELYLEGSDQHRGWFQSSLLTAVGTRGRAPYRSVLTHGFVVDGKGAKMAKSKGNVISPAKIIQQYGAEIIRLWVASENYQEDMRISPDILQRLSDAYRKIRNTVRFMLGNLHDFDPAAHGVPAAQRSELDHWALARLNRLIERVTRAYAQYEFHTMYHAVLNFCITDMSAVYLDILKDRLYCSAADAPARRAAQTTLHEILHDLLRLLAPVLSFTADEAWQYLPGISVESVHLASMPQPDPAREDQELCARWEILLGVRAQVLKHLELARTAKTIGNALDAHVTVTVPAQIAPALEQYRDQLADIFIVSQAALVSGPAAAADTSDRFALVDVQVVPAAGVKCARCWKYFEPDAHAAICPRCAEATT